MSTLDSILHSNMTVLTRDVYQRYVAPSASQAHYIWVGRGFVLVLLLVGYVLSVKTFAFLVTLVTLSVSPNRNMPLQVAIDLLQTQVIEPMEEAGLHINPASMHWVSHWTPPALGNRRFETWFFAARAAAGEVSIDRGEITESRWITPRQALAQHREGEIELVPPTYVSLHYLALHTRVDAALDALVARQPRYYATHIGTSGDDLIAMWAGDAGYASGKPDTPGPRHRLRMGSDGFEFDDSGASGDPG